MQVTLVHASFDFFVDLLRRCSCVICYSNKRTDCAVVLIDFCEHPFGKLDRGDSPALKQMGELPSEQVRSTAARFGVQI